MGVRVFPSSAYTELSCINGFMSTSLFALIARGRAIMELKQSLSGVLPLSEQYTVLHWQSKTRETHGLVSGTSLPTFKVQHFITLAHNDKIFYGLELFVYLTVFEGSHVEQMLFVSKADTNGENDSKASIGLVTQHCVEHVLRIPMAEYFKEVIPKDATRPKYGPNTISRFTGTRKALDILLRRHTGELETPEAVRPYTMKDFPRELKTKIALFTRSEPQYLFPCSSENPSKHILDGESLLKWWLRVLDPVLTSQFETHRAFLRIPSEDDKVIQRYLTPLRGNWSIGDVFGSDPKDIAVFKIPLFPDDPKARFLEHLCVESRVKAVSVAQFWEELQMRQEFRLGVIVSVIGVEGKLKPSLADSSTGLICSYKMLKALKNFITGEDFHDDEGALESYKNVISYLESKKGEGYTDTLKVTGTYVKPQRAVEARVNTITVNNLTTLVRKKQKK